MIKKAPGESGLILGELRGHYLLNPLTHTLTTHLEKVLGMSSLVSEVSLPKTCEDWGTEAKKLATGLQVHSVLTGPKLGYSQKCLCRTFLIAYMRSSKVKQLELGGISVHRFGEIFPDASSWVSVLCRRSGLLKALKHIGFQNSPPEYLTMFACLFNHPGMDLSVQELDSDWGSLLHIVQAYIQQHGMSPHPAVMASIFRAGNLGQ
jgi:hypothetical protein